MLECVTQRDSYFGHCCQSYNQELFLGLNRLQTIVFIYCFRAWHHTQSCYDTLLQACNHSDGDSYAYHYYQRALNRMKIYDLPCKANPNPGDRNILVYNTHICFQKILQPFYLFIYFPYLYW